MWAAACGASTARGCWTAVWKRISASTAASACLPAGLKVLALKPRHGEPLDQSAADCIITRLMDVKEHLD